MKIVLIRHGESEANRMYTKEDPILCGRWDCPLTEKGACQAMKLENDPMIADADIVFSSPLKRAYRTAELINAGRIIIDDRLTERTMGEFDGKRANELKDDPAYSAYFNDPDLKGFRQSFRTRAPGGENYRDVEQRVREFLKDISREKYSKVIIVSHFCTIRCLMKIIMNLSEEETLKLRIMPCDPITVEFDEKASLLFCISEKLT